MLENELIELKELVISENTKLKITVTFLESKFYGMKIKLEQEIK